MNSYDLTKLGSSLLDKLVAVRQALAAGMPPRACETLSPFDNQVGAQSGKGLSGAQAAELNRRWPTNQGGDQLLSGRIGSTRPLYYHSHESL